MFYITDKANDLEVVVHAQATFEMIEAAYECKLVDNREHLRYVVTLDGIEYGVAQIGLLGEAMKRLSTKDESGRDIWWRQNGKWVEGKPAEKIERIRRQSSTQGVQ